jgi:Tfp pilus assembly protein PilF
MAILCSSVRAQITLESLIDDAVTDINSPRYNHVSEAIKRFNLRDVLGARLYLDDARKTDPTLPPTDLTLAKMYFLSRNIVAGRAALEKAVSDFPNDPEAYVLLGEQEIAQGNSVEAEALFDKALLMTEKFSENEKRKRNFGIRTRWGRASVAERRKNWPVMANELQALLKIDDKHAAAHYRLGMALCMQNSFEPGYNEFRKARAEDKTMPNPALALALMFDRLGPSFADRARKAFDQAIVEEKTDLNTMANYSQWLIKTGAHDEAESRLSLARKAHPDAAEILLLSGVAARMRDKPDEAEAHFVAALGKSPAGGSIINQLAQMLIEQDDAAKKSRAMAYAIMNSKLNAESADAQITLAWVLDKQGRKNESMNTLRNGLQLGNFSPDSSYLVAQMLKADQNQIEPAKRLLTEALSPDTTGIFVYRKEAQALLDELNRSSGGR